MGKLNKISLMAAGLFFIHPAIAETTLIKDASIILTGNPTAQGNVEVLHGQDLLIEDGVIKEIGKGIAVESSMKIIDAKGKIVHPGFVDIHDHLWQVTIRGCGHRQELVPWLASCNYIQNDFTHQEGFAAVRLGTYDLINSGVTTVMDWNPSFNKEMAYGGLDALKQSGLRYVFGYYPRTEHDFTYNAQEIKTSLDKDPLGSLMLIGLPNKSEKAHMIKVVTLSKTLNVPVNFHYAESLGEKPYEQSKMLKESGAYERPLMLNHVIHVDAAEIKAMADAGARVAYNPLSNMRLGSGIMPVGKLHDAGITVGLGLDGGAHDNANFFSLMKAAVGIQRAEHKSAATYPDYNTVLLMATHEGAKALGLEKTTGSLEKGKAADLIIINPNTTNMAVNFDEVAQVTLNAEPVNVETVMVNGKILKENGKLVYSDESLEQLIDINKKTVARFMERPAS
jgi:5-methylthioadenosine/S-adenosylhomocysteine deaminase